MSKAVRPLATPLARDEEMRQTIVELAASKEHHLQELQEVQKSLISEER